MMYNTSYKTKICLAEFKGFAQLYCLCRRVRIRNFVFPALVTAFSPRALLGFGVFKLRRVLVRKVPIKRTERDARTIMPLFTSDHIFKRSLSFHVIHLNAQ